MVVFLNLSGGLCIYVIMKLLLYQERDFCKNVNAAEGKPRCFQGQSTSVTQPTMFRKGNVGTSRVFEALYVFCFFFSSFSSYLVWNYIRIVLVQKKKWKTIPKSSKLFVGKSKCHTKAVYSVNYLLNKRKCLVYDCLTHWVALTKLFCFESSLAFWTAYTGLDRPLLVSKSRVLKMSTHLFIWTFAIQKNPEKNKSVYLKINALNI